MDLDTGDVIMESSKDAFYIDLTYRLYEEGDEDNPIYSTLVNYPIAPEQYETLNSYFPVSQKDKLFLRKPLYYVDADLIHSVYFDGTYAYIESFQPSEDSEVIYMDLSDVDLSDALYFSVDGTSSDGWEYSTDILETTHSWYKNDEERLGLFTISRTGGHEEPEERERAIAYLTEKTENPNWRNEKYGRNSEEEVTYEDARYYVDMCHIKNIDGYDFIYKGVVEISNGKTYGTAWYGHYNFYQLTLVLAIQYWWAVLGSMAVLTVMICAGWTAIIYRRRMTNYWVSQSRRQMMDAMAMNEKAEGCAGQCRRSDQNGNHKGL